MLGIIFNSVTMTQGRDGILFPGGLVNASSYYYDAPFINYAPETDTPGNVLAADLLRGLGADIPTPSIDFTISLANDLHVAELIDHPGSLEPSELNELAALLTVDI